MNFVEQYLAGKVSPEDVDGYIEDWHQRRAGIGQKLNEYLGLTWDEYATWVRYPSRLPSILAERSKQNSCN